MTNTYTFLLDKNPWTIVNIFPNTIHQCRKKEKKEFYAEPENLRKFQRQKTSRIRDRNHKSGCDHKWQQKQNKAN